MSGDVGLDINMGVSGTKAVSQCWLQVCMMWMQDGFKVGAGLCLNIPCSAHVPLGLVPQQQPYCSQVYYSVIPGAKNNLDGWGRLFPHTLLPSPTFFLSPFVFFSFRKREKTKCI